MLMYLKVFFSLLFLDSYEKKFLKSYKLNTNFSKKKKYFNRSYSRLLFFNLL